MAFLTDEEDEEPQEDEKPETDEESESVDMQLQLIKKTQLDILRRLEQLEYYQRQLQPPSNY